MRVFFTYSLDTFPILRDTFHPTITTLHQHEQYTLQLSFFKIPARTYKRQ
jgi:hypothetical protein